MRYVLICEGKFAPCFQNHTVSDGQIRICVIIVNPRADQMEGFAKQAYFNSNY